MRCGRPEHEQGEKCAARHAKCKDCHKIGHFYKVCQSSKRTVRTNLAQVTPQEDKDNTFIDECGYTQPAPPAINMLKVISNTGTTSGTESLKFPIDVNPRGTYKHHLEVSIDTGADVNCMNEKTFKKLFPEVDLSVCPHSIQNFGNSTADVYILGQFRTYLKFRGRKYLNTFIVTNANDCPNILSHGAIFRMGILVPNYPEENMVKLRDMETGTSNVFQVLQDLRMKQYQGNSVCPHSIQNFGNSTADVYILGQFRTYLKFRGRKYLNTFIVTNANDCPNILSHGAIFRMGILVPNYPEENMVKLRDMETGTSNVFQVLQDLRMKQYQGNSEPRAHRPNTTQPKASKTPKSCETASQKAGTYTDNMSPIQTSFRTIPTPEPNTAHSTRRPTSRIHQPHSHSEHKTCCMHVHQQQSKTYRMEEPPALREVKHPHRDRTSVSRSPSTEQEVLSQFSSSSEEIEHFTRDPYTTHLKSCTQSTDYAFKGQEVHTYIDCEYSHGHMNDHLIQNTPHFRGKQFLQEKEKITCTDMESTPGMMNTYTFTPGSTTLSIPTHSRKIPQRFQQLEKESSNTVALPGFNHNADTTTYVETSRNMHSNGTLSTSLKTDTNMYANMDTNHMAHRYRDTRKEVHLLSGPSEL